MRRIIMLVLMATVFALPSFAQSATPTTTSTPTSTPTRTPTVTRTPTPTYTRNLTIRTPQLPLTERRMEQLIGTSPGAQLGNLAEILHNGLRAISINSTNATALGRTDIKTVVAIFAFTTSTGAPATKTLLERGTDYTASNGDVTAVGDHSAETWVILYRP